MAQVQITHKLKYSFIHNVCKICSLCNLIQVYSTSVPHLHLLLSQAQEVVNHQPHQIGPSPIMASGATQRMAATSTRWCDKTR
jgi:hypothetical protein